MIDKQAFNKYLKEYKKDFDTRWKDESFKWKAIKTFENNWDLKVKDLEDMAKSSFSDTESLLTSNNFLPAKMIQNFFSKDSKQTKKMFEDLFDDAKDIGMRYSEFKEMAKELTDKYWNNKSSYQNANSISTYLWLKYPEKYAIFKFSECKIANDLLKAGYMFKRGNELDNVKNFYEFNNELCGLLNNDEEIKDKLKSHTSNKAEFYKDEKLKTLSIDFIHYLSQNNDTFSKGNNIFQNELKKIVNSKNTILYGPPGTGKTYNTAIYAVAICEYKGDISKATNMDYKTEILPMYKKLKDEGKIEFITFHQSYGYEEFVEGIKPIPDDDKLLYEVTPGIFKNFCEKSFDDSKFEKLWDALIEEVKKSGQPLKVKTQKATRELEWDDTKKRFNVINYKERGQFVNYHHVLAVYKGEFDNNKGSGTNQVKYSTAKAIIELLKQDYKLGDYNNEKDNNPKVFIIDEINRGNISKIFGELITLIEESKREGESEELSCVLPYSNENFSVPSNVYILGTMNTADKSLTAIDTALRRRFKFIEMMPDYSIIPNDIESIDLSLMLEKMNERIEALLDREHTIGHSYFMKVKNFEDLREIMHSEIIPLLQEYFFDDYENIRLVLGDNQVEDKDKQFIIAEDFNPNLFGNDAPETGEKKKYIINDREVEAAYTKIYK